MNIIENKINDFDSFTKEQCHSTTWTSMINFLLLLFLPTKIISKETSNVTGIFNIENYNGCVIDNK